MLKLKLQYFVIWCKKLTHWKKVPDAGKAWGQQEKRASEDEMAGWHHWCSGHELGGTPGDDEGQGGLVCCSLWDIEELDMPGQLNNNNWDDIGTNTENTGWENECAWVADDQKWPKALYYLFFSSDISLVGLQPCSHLINLFFVLFWAEYVAYRILKFPNQGSNLYPLQWNCADLTSWTAKEVTHDLLLSC